VFLKRQARQGLIPRHILQYVTGRVGLGERELDEEAGEGVGGIAPDDFASVDVYKSAVGEACDMAADIEFRLPRGLHERGLVCAFLGLDDFEQPHASLVRKRRKNREEGRRLGTTAIDEDKAGGFGAEELLHRGKKRHNPLVRCIWRRAIEAVFSIAG